MIRSPRHQLAHDALEAFGRARTPTPTLTQGLCDVLAQMLADQLRGPVAICLPGNIKIARSPGANQ